MTEQEALFWVGRLVAVATGLQTLEYLQIRRVLADDGIWRWSTLKEDFDFFPRPLRWVLSLVLAYSGFIWVLLLRLAAATGFLVFPHAAFMGVLVVTTILVLWRFRGTYNGGSDCMTLIVLMAVFLATLFQDVPGMAKGCLWYIALQACASYFIAGLAKLRVATWRVGEALPAFIRVSTYVTPPLARRLIQNRALAWAASWLIIVWECIFPAAFLSPGICLVFIASAFVFHLGNFYLFGLNRFVFAWCSAYPALYFCSSAGAV